MDRGKPLLVTGHRNPDTDSICAAIAYADFKRTVLRESAEACRAGSINSQTRHALDTFGADDPRLLADVLPRISDIMIGGDALLLIRPSQPLADAYRIIVDQRFAFLPVVDEDRVCVGKITALGLAARIGSLDRDLAEEIDVDLAAFARLCGDTLDAGWPGRAHLRVSFVAADPGKADAEAGAGESGAGASRSDDRLVVRCGVAGGARFRCASDPTERPLVVEVGAGVAQATANLLLARAAEAFVEPAGPVFLASTPIRDAEAVINTYNEGGFIVNDDDGRIAGVVTRVNFMTDSRFRVALVDHNELAQAVDGIEHARIEEIVDHHRIGMERTSEPITVINRVVGSTCTIVAEMFRRSGVDPSPTIAGLMLSGLLSDTVVLHSPTATDLDREIAPWLAGIADIGIEEYGRAMFAAGSEAEALSAREILLHDRKRYDEKGHRFSVSQIEMVGFEGYWRRHDELAEAVADIRTGEELFFACLMVTDITTSTTLLLIDAPATFRSRVTYPQPADGVYEMKGVLSRKKQVLPLLLELL